MTKQELIEAAAGAASMKKMDLVRALESVLGTIGNALASGDQVKLTGLGTFKLKETKARQARNPKTGEAVAVPAKKVLRFVPGKELKERIQK